MQHKNFHWLSDLLSGSETFAYAYVIFLQSTSVPPSLEDDIHRPHQLVEQNSD